MKVRQIINIFVLPEWQGKPGRQYMIIWPFTKIIVNEVHALIIKGIIDIKKIN